MKLAQPHVCEDEDTDEWALSRMEILCRLSPLRLARKVMETDDALNQETFIDHVICAVLFIDYSRICELTTALFKRQGLFVRTHWLGINLTCSRFKRKVLISPWKSTFNVWLQQLGRHSSIGK